MALSPTISELSALRISEIARYPLFSRGGYIPPRTSTPPPPARPATVPTTSGPCRTSTGVAGYEDCGAPPMGLAAYPGLPVPRNVEAQYSIVALRNKPARAPSDFPIACEACLRARGILYWHRLAGDCGQPVPLTRSSGGQIVGLSGSAASGVIGGLGAVGALTGAVTFGIGTAITVAVGAIEEIFSNHAQAVKREQDTICSVANFFNPVVAKIDQAVRIGAISATQGMTFMRQICDQSIQGLSSIEKACNAACVYIGILKAHKDFAQSLYPAIAPKESISANDPGGAPDYFGTPPGGVNASSNTFGNAAPPPPIRSLPENTYAPAGPSPSGLFAPSLTPNRLLPSGCVMEFGGIFCQSDYLNKGYNQPTGQEAQAADVPTLGNVNWAMWGAIAAIVALFIVLLRPAGAAA